MYQHDQQHNAQFKVNSQAKCTKLGLTYVLLVPNYK